MGVVLAEAVSSEPPLFMRLAEVSIAKPIMQPINSGFACERCLCDLLPLAVSPNRRLAVCRQVCDPDPLLRLRATGKC